jgi:hypothetical protein
MISRMVSNSGLGVISAQDVKILSEISNTVAGPAVLSPAQTEMIALLTKKANDGEDGGQAFSDEAAENLVEAVHNMGPQMSPGEAAEAKRLLQAVESTLTDSEAEVALLFIESLMPRLDAATVKVAVEAAKNSNLLPDDAKVCSARILSLCNFDICTFAKMAIFTQKHTAMNLWRKTNHKNTFSL